MANITHSCNALTPSSNILVMQSLIDGIYLDMAAMNAQLTQLRADFAAHVHGGGTVGAGVTLAPGSVTAVAVTLQTKR